MKLNHILYPALALCPLAFGACSDEFDVADGTPSRVDDGTFPTTEGIPDYEDDYTSIAAWTYHMQWGLANVHDPSVTYYNGYYFMFGTDASYGNAHDGHGHFQGKYSPDLVNWKWCPGVFYNNNRPAWIAEKVNEYRAMLGLEAIAEADMNFGYWAPVVRTVTVNGVTKIRMYYSIVVDNYIGNGLSTVNTKDFDNTWSERSLIGCAETTDPLSGVWEDKGFVTTSSSDKGKDDGTYDYSRASLSDWNAKTYYNAIDPTYIVTPEGEHWLIHGSWHSGFTALQINAETGLPLKPVGTPWASSAAGLAENGFGVRIASRNSTSRWQGSEAPEVIYRDGYYYLFMAYDGLDIPYNTRVCRSTSITGPYRDIRGIDITSGNEAYPIVTHPYKFGDDHGWVGISHCCIFEKEDAEDEWFYMSQARFPANYGGNTASNAIMMGHVRRIVWAPASPSKLDERWPVALPERYAGLKNTSAVTRSELVGNWEHINLRYNSGNQDASGSLVLNEDGTMSGLLTGNWSFDEANQLLTLGSTAVVCVTREADWEASPRVETIVYAGFSNNTTTFWGKKVQ